jgi:hypothetical protein
MKEIFYRFVRRIIILSIFLTILGILLYFILPAGKFSPAAPFMPLFFLAVTAGLYYMLLKSTENKFSRFVTQFMIITFAKLFIYIIILVAYTFLNKPDAVPFILTFFIFYLIYTIFEIMSFLGDQKKLNK